MSFLRRRLSLGEVVSPETGFLGRAPRFSVRRRDRRGNVNGLLYCANVACLPSSPSPSRSVYLVWLWCIWTWLGRWGSERDGPSSSSAGKWEEAEKRKQWEVTADLHRSHWATSAFHTLFTDSITSSGIVDCSAAFYSRFKSKYLINRVIFSVGTRIQKQLNKRNKTKYYHLIWLCRSYLCGVPGPIWPGREY